jgi:hypothetical protein
MGEWGSGHAMNLPDAPEILSFRRNVFMVLGKKEL